MKRTSIAITILLVLTSCSNDVKSSLGIKKTAPDEFTVISYPPLSVPPEFSLEVPSSESTYTISSYNANGFTTEEANLLNKISSQKIMSKTKFQIDQENAAKRDKAHSKGVITKTIDNLNGSNEEPVIDPEKEKERIDKNIKELQPINEGEVENKGPTSTLKRIFG